MKTRIETPLAKEFITYALEYENCEMCIRDRCNRGFSSAGAVEIRFGFVHLNSLPSMITARTSRASEQHADVQRQRKHAGGLSPCGRSQCPESCR